MGFQEDFETFKIRLLAFEAEIGDAAEKFRVDSNLIKAIIMKESSCLSCRTRPEPGYKWLWNVRDVAARRGVTFEAEEAAQKMSYGLMQLMGACAREYGFTDDLTMLTVPRIGVYYGTKHLRRYLDKYGGDEPKVMAAYNAGSARMTAGGFFENQKYVDEVSMYLRGLRALA